eukprot:8626238-Alexandrium_andersonii.AAC.1
MNAHPVQTPRLPFAVPPPCPPVHAGAPVPPRHFLTLERCRPVASGASIATSKASHQPLCSSRVARRLVAMCSRRR